MADEKAVVDVVEEEMVTEAGLEEMVVDDTPQLVLTTGIAEKTFSQTSKSFVPALREDMSPEERSATVRTSMKRAMQVQDGLELVVGELLYEVYKNAYWREWTFTDEHNETRAYSKFEEYASVECNGMPGQKAKYLMKIYEKYIVELQLAPEALANLQVSKAKALLDVVDPENVFEILDKTQNMTVSQVTEFVKDIKQAALPSPEGDEEGGGGIEAAAERAAKLSTISFKVTPSQLETVGQATKLAQELSGSDKPAAQLEYICADFLANSMGSGAEGALSSLERFIDMASKAFGVELEIKSVDPNRFTSLADDADSSEEADVVE